MGELLVGLPLGAVPPKARGVYVGECNMLSYALLALGCLRLTTIFVHVFIISL